MLFKKKNVNEHIEEQTPFREEDIITKEDIDVSEISEEDYQIKELSEHKDEYVSLKNINKIYNRKVHAVIDFNLDVKQREFVVFVGPSGCGKSTTLRMIAGLEEISAGELYIDGVYSNDLSPKDRDIAMVFQSYSLYPNMTVYDNLAFSLKVKRLPKEEIDKRVKSAAKILEITDYLDRKPSQLSGGQKQRVALGRTIVRNSKIFLMDEPLSNLDAKLRVQMRSEIIKLHKKVKATTIYVTHDQIEAMTMADRIVVMKDGYVQQIGTPLEIYRKPINQFVASFIGSPAMNFVDAIYDNGTLHFNDGTIQKLTKDDVTKHNNYYKQEFERVSKLIPEFEQYLKEEYAAKGKKVFKKVISEEDYLNDSELLNLKEHLEEIKKILDGQSHQIMFGIRPEDIIVSDEGFEKEVVFAELLGLQYYVHFNYGGKEIISSIFSEKMIHSGEKIKLKFKENKYLLFDYLTGKTIY